MNRTLSHPVRPSHSTPPRVDPTAVTVHDLGRIDVLQGLLATLNDPLAGAGSIAKHVDHHPVLKARIEARFVKHHTSRAIPGVAEQIAKIGNRELEAVLLELLEDIVTLHCDQKEAIR